MNKYEILYIIDNDVSEEDKAALVDRFSDLVVKLGGTVDGIDKWGTRKYAYPINDKNEGYYDIVDVPDFVKLAEAYGCVGMRAFTKDEAIECIKKANEINDRPVLIDFRVWKDAMVWPMVAAGDSNDNVTYMPGVKPLQRAGENE